jgi:hypothetical protein
VVALSARWPFARTADQALIRPDRLLRDNPVLLLSALQTPGTVAALVAAWNPGWNPGWQPAGDPNAESAAESPTAQSTALAEGIRWHGPLRLTPMLRADAGLPTAGPAASLGIAYVAEVRRSRAKILDSRQAHLLRLRYPQGLPTGAEADAWHLVRGLAKRLRGVARLPGGPMHAPHQDAPLPGDGGHAVYSHEMLPWIVLRELLRPLAPELVREVVPDGGGYILRHRALLEVRVRPAGPGMRLPHALRRRADDAWPHSVYEFCDVTPPVVRPAAPRPAGVPAGPPARAAAALIAEVTGGVHLDADGFPEETRTFSGR